MLLAYLAFSTLLGARLAGRQASLRDFFLGGRKLPWPAVAGSIVATEISAVTFISVPAIAFAPGGDLTYLQLMLGALLARILIAVWFVPAFYQREIYSPYDYVGHRLGSPARTVTTALFLLGAVLGQSVRVLLTAVILEEITSLPLACSIWIIGAVAIGWTLLGGISIVVWTDVIQFFVFVAALTGTLLMVISRVDGGWSGVLATAAAAGKTRLWDLSLDPDRAFTLWAALLGNTLLCLNAYGTDQMIAQRMFCCRSRRHASLAILASSVGLLVAVLAITVGLGLYAFYQQYPLDPATAERVAAAKDRIFPIFIVREIPPGLTGLVLAGVFAAAISSLDSVLAALSQTVVTGLYRPWRERRGNPPRSERHYLLASRLLVVGWGVVLCAMAWVAELARQRYEDILNLALAMATYTGGATLAAFLLALLRFHVDYRGLIWSAPISVLTVFAVSWHVPWAQALTVVASTAIFLAWIVYLFQRRSYPTRDWGRDAARTLFVAAGCGLAVFLNLFRHDGPGGPAFLAIAWPWNVPLGFTVALTLGVALAHPARPARSGRTPTAARF